MHYKAIITPLLFASASALPVILPPGPGWPLLLPIFSRQRSSCYDFKPGCFPPKAISPHVLDAGAQESSLNLGYYNGKSGSTEFGQTSPEDGTNTFAPSDAASQFAQDTGSSEPFSGNHGQTWPLNRANTFPGDGRQQFAVKPTLPFDYLNRETGEITRFNVVPPPKMVDARKAYFNSGNPSMTETTA